MCQRFSLCFSSLAPTYKNKNKSNGKINNDSIEQNSQPLYAINFFFSSHFLYFIFSSIFAVDYFSLHGKNNTYDDLAIREFLESAELTVLAAINHGDKLIFTHNITEDENCLVFYKIPQIGNGIARQSSMDDDNASILPLGILTLEGGLAKSIYNSISRVYSPYVAKVN